METPNFTIEVAHEIVEKYKNTIAGVNIRLKEKGAMALDSEREKAASDLKLYAEFIKDLQIIIGADGQPCQHDWVQSAGITVCINCGGNYQS